MLGETLSATVAYNAVALFRRVILLPYLSIEATIVAGVSSDVATLSVMNYLKKSDQNYKESARNCNALAFSIYQ